MNSRYIFLLFLSKGKTKCSTKESTKIRHFDIKISKNFGGGGTAPTDSYPRPISHQMQLLDPPLPDQSKYGCCDS